MTHSAGAREVLLWPHLRENVAAGVQGYDGCYCLEVLANMNMNVLQAGLYCQWLMLDCMIGIVQIHTRHV